MLKVNSCFEVTIQGYDFKKANNFKFSVATKPKCATYL
jgi:hypothetical protein